MLRGDLHRVTYRLRRVVDVVAARLFGRDPEEPRGANGPVALLPEVMKRFQHGLDSVHSLFPRGVALGGGQRGRALSLDFLQDERVEDLLVNLDRPRPRRGLAHARRAVMELTGGGGGGGGRRRRLPEELGESFDDSVATEQRALVHHEQHTGREHLQGFPSRIQPPVLLQAQLQVPQTQRESHAPPS